MEFDHARQLVQATIDTWDNDTWQTTGTGLEDPDAFMVDYAPQAYLNGDPLAIRADQPVALVAKATGNVSFVPYHADLDRFAAMTPVGEPAR